jgi:hypothetical protein
LEEPTAEPDNCRSQSPARSEKRLARGLEDVSHLFLSQSAAPAPAAAETRGGADNAAPVSCPGRAAPILLTKAAPLSENELTFLLHSNTGVLEEGLRSIDKGLPCDDSGPIGLVAVDTSNQLVIIDIDTSPGDQLLLRGICHFDWMVRNVPVARRMYHGRVIDFSAQPRLFLVAPQFSSLFLRAARRIAQPVTHCFRFQFLTVQAGTGIHFERV